MASVIAALGRRNPARSLRRDDIRKGKIAGGQLERNVRRLIGEPVEYNDICTVEELGNMADAIELFLSAEIGIPRYISRALQGHFNSIGKSAI